MALLGVGALCLASACGGPGVTPSGDDTGADGLVAPRPDAMTPPSTGSDGAVVPGMDAASGIDGMTPGPDGSVPGPDGAGPAPDVTPPPPDVPVVSHGTWSWQQSGIFGGGMENGIAADPRNPGHYISMTDVGGHHRTLNGGDDWLGAENGIQGPTNNSTVVFSDALPNTVYLGLGLATSSPMAGRLYVSSDGGASWTRRATINFLIGPGADQPRVVGRRIASDDGGSPHYLYAGADALYRSTDDGATFTQLGLPFASAGYITGVALDPTDHTTLYVATRDRAHGAWRVTNVRSAAPVFTQLTGAPPSVEEFVAIGSTLYAAVGTSGIYRVTDRGMTWAAANTVATGGSLVLGTGAWAAIDGYHDAATNQDVLYAAACNAAMVNGTYGSLAKSLDGGRTWRWLLDPMATNVHFTVAGTTQTWWLQGNPLMLGQDSYNPSQLVIDPFNRQRVMLSGRSGVWRTDDGGATWVPAINHLSGVGVVGVGTAPDGSAGVVTLDWGFIASHGGHLDAVRQNRPGTGFRSGDAVVVGDDGTFYVSVGSNRSSDNTMSDLYQGATTDPTTTTWSAITPDASGRRYHALAVGHASATDRSAVLIAAQDGGGLWRRAGGAWRQVMPAFDGGRGAKLAWPDPAQPYVYAADGAGVYRSTDAGATWTMLSPGGATDLAGDPTRPGHLYALVGGTAMMGGTLYEYADARSGSTRTALAVSNVGMIGTGRDGALYAVTLGTPRDVVRRAPGGTAFSSIGDDALHDMVANPLAFAVGPDDYLYVALYGGVAVGTPHR